MRVKAVFSPAKSGRTVWLQQRTSGNTWKTIETGKEDRSGTEVFATRAPSSPGTFVLRVLAPADGRLAAVQSPALGVIVHPSEETWAGNTTCRDVLYIGARGSGQTWDTSSWGMGSEVYEAWKRYRSQLARGVNAGFAQVDYPAVAVDVIYAGDFDRFLASIDTGADVLEGFFRKRTQDCPTERHVLAGFSQGAMVVHRVLWDLTSKDRISDAALDRIDGVLAIADGDRWGNQRGNFYGTAPADAWVGIGHEFSLTQLGRRHPPRIATIDPQIRARYHDVCLLGDPVCRFVSGAEHQGDWPSLMAGWDEHGNAYRSNGNGEFAGDGVPGVRLAVAAIATRTNGQAVQIATYGLPPAVVGQAYDYTLTTTDPVAGAWSLAEGALPAGLVLGRDGRITGVPTGASGTLGTSRVVVRFTTASGAASTSELWITLTSESGWRSLSTGDRYVCGVRNDNTGWCWGTNRWGELGNGTAGDPHPIPRQIPGQWRFITATNYSGTCGIQTDDSLWCWGSGSHYRPAGSTAEDRYSPMQVPGAWRSVSISLLATCGVRTDGTGWCWGENSHGTLGDGTTVDRNTPTVPVAATGPGSGPGAGSGVWREITVVNQTVCGVQTDWSGWCWGRSRWIPDPEVDWLSLTPVRVEGKWRTLAPYQVSPKNGDAEEGMCGIAPDGSSWCWGESTNVPVFGVPATFGEDLVEAPGVWASRDVGATTCGVQIDASGWCWGVNYLGAVGDGTVVDRETPYEAPGLWLELSTSHGTTCGVQVDNTGWCWGYNGYFGYVGNGTPTGTVVEPSQIVGRWLSITRGAGETTCGIQTDGSAWCWGDNREGQVGDGYISTSRRLPTQVMS